MDLLSGIISAPSDTFSNRMIKRRETSMSSGVMIGTPAEQVAEHGVGGIIQRLQMPDLEIFFENQVREILKEAARIPGAHDQAVAIRQV